MIWIILFQYAVSKVHQRLHSSLAQSVEHSAVNRSVVGSSPTGGVFLFRNVFIRPRGQAVKTSPFHGGNTGSIPVGVILELVFCMYGVKWFKLWTFSSVG